MWIKCPRDILVIPNYITYVGVHFINSWNFFWTVFYTMIQFRLIKNYSQWLPCFNSSLFPLHTKLHTRNIHRPSTSQILQFTKNQFFGHIYVESFHYRFLFVYTYSLGSAMFEPMLMPEEWVEASSSSGGATETSMVVETVEVALRLWQNLLSKSKVAHEKSIANWINVGKTHCDHVFKIFSSYWVNKKDIFLSLEHILIVDRWSDNELAPVTCIHIFK